MKPGIKYLCGVSLVLAAGVFAGTSLYVLRTYRSDLAGLHDSSQTRLAQLVQRGSDLYVDRLRLLAQWGAAQGRKPEDRREWARKLLETTPEIHSVVEVDEKGNIVFAEPAGLEARLVPPAGDELRDVLVKARASRSPVVSEGAVGSGEGRVRVLSAAVPVPVSGKAAGKAAATGTRVLAVNVAATSAREALQAAPLEEAPTTGRLERVLLGAGGAGFLLLALAFGALAWRLSRLGEDVEAQEGRYRSFSSRVANDLRAPLSALASILETSGRLEPEARHALRSAVGKLRDIANQCLGANEYAGPEETSALTVSAVDRPPAETREPAAKELLSSLVDSWVTEKRLEYRSRDAIEIEYELDPLCSGIFARVARSELKRIFHDLLENSLESLDGQGRVRVSVEAEGPEAAIRIRDDGRGVGHGLGIDRARARVEAWGGSLRVEALVDGGSITTLKLPRAEAPGWFVDRIRLRDGLTLVVLDDDLSIHHVWSRRFEAALRAGVELELLTYSRPEDLERWHHRRSPRPADTLYVLDYELLGGDDEALDRLERLGIEGQTVLVTSRFEESGFRKRCLDLGLRLLPKGMAESVPIWIPPSHFGEGSGLTTRYRIEQEVRARSLTEH